MTAATTPDDGWIAVVPTSAVGEAPLAVAVAGRALVVWRTASGRWCALDDDCPHQGTELSGGSVDGETLRCPKHGWAVGTDGWCDQAGGATLAHRVQVRDDVVHVRLRGAGR